MTSPTPNNDITPNPEIAQQPELVLTWLALEEARTLLEPAPTDAPAK